MENNELKIEYVEKIEPAFKVKATIFEIKQKEKKDNRKAKQKQEIERITQEYVDR